MKKTTTKRSVIIFLLTIISIHSIAQSRNIFESKESVKNFLDGKKYLVPEYGSLKFDYNSRETKKWAELREKDKTDDEKIDVVFDISVKRNAAKKKDRGDYQVSLQIDLSDPEGQNYSPVLSYANSFFLLRSVIYPIKDFPSVYILFADGDLYFEKSTYQNISFQDYKSNVLQNILILPNKKLIKCIELK